MQVASLQCELESSQSAELQLSQHVEELESTIHRLHAESSSQSNALRDCCADVSESDVIQQLTVENVSARFRLASRIYPSGFLRLTKNHDYRYIGLQSTTAEK